jgi:hypothetical protein
MLRFLLVLALVFGLATPATAQAVTPRLRGEDPLALVGWWRVAATGETVVIDPSRFEVRSGTGTAEGSWVGDSAGRFLARADGEPPAWLGASAGFVANGPDRVLLDRTGAPVARLVPAPAGASTGADPARPPSDLELRGRGPVVRSPRTSHRSATSPGAGSPSTTSATTRRTSSSPRTAPGPAPTAAPPPAARGSRAPTARSWPPHAR